MIEYKILKSNSENIIECVLENRNIDIDYVNKLLTANEMFAPNTMKNIAKAIEVLNSSIHKNENILIQSDSDCDGVCSTGILYDFIYNVLGYKNIKYIKHKNRKSHGVTPDLIQYIEKNKVDLLLLPDSSSSLKDYRNMLSIKKNIKVIITDHHDVEYSPLEQWITMINPKQLECKYENKQLSGCGVTYKFIVAFANYKGIDLGTKYLDLVALTLISDMCDMKYSIENRAICNIGLLKSNIKSPFLKRMIDLKKLGTDRISIEECAFSIANLINACVRNASSEDNDMLIESLYSFKLVESNKRGNCGALVDVQDEIIRRLGNNKQNQDKKVKLYVAAIKKYIENNKLYDNPVIIVDVSNVDTAYTGLIANKIMADYKKCVILYREKSRGIVGGSARSYQIKNFKQICEKSELFEFCSGHQSAWGFSIEKSKLNKLLQYLEEVLSSSNNSTILEVDAAYNVCPPLQDIIDISSLDELWCNDIKEPRFIIKDVEIDTSKIMKIGNTTYTWKNNNITFTKNFGSKVFIEEFTKQELTDVNKKQRYPFESKYIVCDIVCRFRKNDRGYAYVDIVDAVSKELELIY